MVRMGNTRGLFKFFNFQTMPKAYSEDLRWRAVWLSVVRGMSYSEIAEVLFMSEKSVYRYLSLFHSSGSVKAREPTGNQTKGLSDFESFTVLQTILHNPKVYLEEIQQELFDITGRWVHVSTICRTVKKHGFTRKTVQSIALQQSESKRIQFMSEISLFDPDMLIWIDETGSTRRNNIRTFGYSLRGTRPRTHILRVSGERLSAIPVMTTRGIEDVYVCTGSVNGDVFEQFLCQCVLPIILPFDGNNPRSVIVMDNASIHHVERVYEIITGVGAKLVFLPPYSPDLMPLEEVFSKVKAALNANEHMFLYSLTPSLILKLAFNTVTQKDCLAYIRHAGYM